MVPMRLVETSDPFVSRIIVWGEDGLQVWREIHGNVGYLTMHSKEQHVGARNAGTVDVAIE